MKEKTYREKVIEKAAAEKKRRTRKTHKKGKQSWSGYLALSDHPKVKHGTEQAKTVLEEMLPQFLVGLNERIDGEKEWWREQGAASPWSDMTEKEWRYLMAGFYFFKWLGQMPLFDDANDPGKPIPLVLVWINTEGKLGFVHNFIGDHLENMISVATVLHPMMEHVAEYFDKEQRKVEKWKRKQASKEK